MPEPRDDEFYVGYLSEAPPGVAARVRLSVTLLLGLALAAPFFLVSRQQRFDPGVFEFGVVRELHGIVGEAPFPALWVERPGATAFSRYDLVAFGKHGADDQVAGLGGRAVRLRGTLVYRAGRTMVETVGASIETTGDSDLELRFAAWQRPPEDLGERTLVGEIIDTKCYLGVMKPGRSKPHKACAIRCISGGIPPALMVEDRTGRREYYLLVGADGRTVNREILDFVAEPVEIRGRVEQHGDRLWLKADPATYRRKRGHSPFSRVRNR